MCNDECRGTHGVGVGKSEVLMHGVEHKSRD